MQRGAISAPLFFVCYWWSQCGHAQEATVDDWALWGRIDSVSYSEPVSVYSAFHELEGHFERGDEAFTHNQIELGMSKGPWSLALIGRYDYHVSMDPDTVELAHREENNLPLDVGRSYSINGFVNHTRSTGIKFGYQFQPLTRLRLRVAASYLHADQLLHGGANGLVTIEAADTFSGAADVDYVYTEDVLLGRAVNEPSGDGYCVDAYATWQPADRWTVSAAVEDWLHYIEWRDAPFTQARVTSSTSNLDEDGFIETTPVLSGLEGERDFRQSLPVRTRLDVRYVIDARFELTAGALNVDSINLPELGVRYRHGDDRTWSFTYGTESKSISLGLETNGWQALVGLDRLDYEEAHYISLRFGFVHRW